MGHILARIMFRLESLWYTILRHEVKALSVPGDVVRII